MTLAEALTILDAVCAHHVGTLADHQQIQAALELVKADLERDD